MARSAELRGEFHTHSNNKSIYKVSKIYLLIICTALFIKKPKRNILLTANVRTEGFQHLKSDPWAG